MHISFKIFLSFFWFLLVIILISNCNNPTQQELKPQKLYVVPKYYYEPIEIPDALAASTDSMAQVTMAYVQAHNAMSEYVELLHVRKEEITNGYPWQKKWTDKNGVDVTLELTYQKNYQYIWKIYFDGTDNNTGRNYDNWLHLKADLGMLGYSEDLIIYDYDSNYIKLWHSWNKRSTIDDDYSLVKYVQGTISEKLTFNVDFVFDYVQVLRYLSKNEGAYWHESTCSYTISTGEGSWHCFNENGSLAGVGSWD